MTIKPPVKPKHLFVVKEGTSAPEGRMVSAESLSAEQQLTVKRYQQLASASGILVGAFVTPEGWDVRPLLLSEGVLYLLRFSDPKIALQKSRLSFLRASCERLAQGAESRAAITHGEVEGQVWVRRKYFSSTVAEDSAANSGMHPLQFAQKLIRAVSAMHAASIIHGHLCPQNVAVDNQEVFLMDHSFIVSALPLDREVPTLAPELQNSPIPTFAADVYGLGLVLKACAIAALGPEQQLCIDRMLSSEPGVRPSMEVVRETFMPLEAQHAKPATVATMVSAAPGLSSGRLVPRPQAPPEPTAAARVEGFPKIIAPALPAVTAQQVPEWKRSHGPETPAEQNHLPPAAPASTAVEGQTSLHGLLLGAVLVAALGYGGYRFMQNQAPTLDPALLGAAWSSSQPSRMQQVADAAVRGDPQAQIVIVSDALRGQARPLVRSSLIRMAFDSAWEKDLSEADRRIILSLALIKLLSNQRLELPPLHEAHPAVTLAIAGDTPDLQVPQGSPELAAVPMSKMALLSAPYGEMFSLLERTGVKTMAELPARGLAHIVSGDASDTSMRAYFSASDSRDVALMKLAILYPLARRVPKVEEALFSALSSQSGPLNESLVWFASEDLPQWSKVSRVDLLALVAGELPAGDLTPEQYADLLRFPDKSLREKVRAKLIERVANAKLAPVFNVLSSDTLRLSRFQVITLVSTMQLQGEASYALLGSLLETNPDPRAILALLLARSGFERLDPVNVELARYVARSNPHASFDELKKLSTHPEQLARAFAYARLDPNEAAQREVLEAAVVVEPSERLRAQIAEKLKGIVIEIPTPSPTSSATAAVPKQVKPTEEDLDLDPF